VANIKSAEKRNRQRTKRRARNIHHLSTMRTLVKRVQAAIEAKDPKAPEMLRQAASIIDKTAQKGVIKRATASRKISRLAHAVKNIAAPQA
jgi:small subunit ribosomal protein S20